LRPSIARALGALDGARDVIAMVWVRATNDGVDVDGRRVERRRDAARATERRPVSRVRSCEDERGHATRENTAHD
jgi:hypothetical protein